MLHIEIKISVNLFFFCFTLHCFILFFLHHPIWLFSKGLLGGGGDLENLDCIIFMCRIWMLIFTDVEGNYTLTWIGGCICCTRVLKLYMQSLNDVICWGMSKLFSTYVAKDRFHVAEYVLFLNIWNILPLVSLPPLTELKPPKSAHMILSRTSLPDNDGDVVLWRSSVHGELVTLSYIICSNVSNFNC